MEGAYRADAEAAPSRIMKNTCDAESLSDGVNRRVKPLQERRGKTAAGNGAEDGARGLSPVLDRYMYPLDYGWSSNLEAKRVSRTINSSPTRNKLSGRVRLGTLHVESMPCPRLPHRTV